MGIGSLNKLDGALELRKDFRPPPETAAKEVSTLPPTALDVFVQGNKKDLHFHNEPRRLVNRGSIIISNLAYRDKRIQTIFSAIDNNPQLTGTDKNRSKQKLPDAPNTHHGSLFYNEDYFLGIDMLLRPVLGTLKTNQANDIIALLDMYYGVAAQVSIDPDLWTCRLAEHLESLSNHFKAIGIPTDRAITLIARLIELSGEYTDRALEHTDYLLQAIGRNKWGVKEFDAIGPTLPKGWYLGEEISVPVELMMRMADEPDLLLDPQEKWQLYNRLNPRGQQSLLAILEDHERQRPDHIPHPNLMRRLTVHLNACGIHFFDATRYGVTPGRTQDLADFSRAKELFETWWLPHRLLPRETYSVIQGAAQLANIEPGHMLEGLAPLFPWLSTQGFTWEEIRILIASGSRHHIGIIKSRTEAFKNLCLGVLADEPDSHRAAATIADVLTEYDIIQNPDLIHLERKYRAVVLADRCRFIPSDVIGAVDKILENKPPEERIGLTLDFRDRTELVHQTPGTMAQIIVRDARIGIPHPQLRQLSRELGLTVSANFWMSDEEFEELALALRQFHRCGLLKTEQVSQLLFADQKEGGSYDREKKTITIYRPFVRQRDLLTTEIEPVDHASDYIYANFRTLGVRYSKYFELLDLIAHELGHAYDSTLPIYTQLYQRFFPGRPGEELFAEDFAHYTLSEGTKVARYSRSGYEYPHYIQRFMAMKQNFPVKAAQPLLPRALIATQSETQRTATQASLLQRMLDEGRIPTAYYSHVAQILNSQDPDLITLCINLTQSGANDHNWAEALGITTSDPSNPLSTRNTFDQTTSSAMTAVTTFTASVVPST